LSKPRRRHADAAFASSTWSHRSLALLAAAVGVAGASGSPQQAAGTLDLHALFDVKGNRVDCAPGAPATTICVQTVGTGTVSGLGKANVMYRALVDEANSDCLHVSWTAAAITVAGKGEIDVSLTDPYSCHPKSFIRTRTVDFAVTGGSGMYAGASGNGTVENVHVPVSEFPGVGDGIDTWSGPLTVPGLDFDVTAPTVSGAVRKTVRAPNKAKRARVRYTVTAKDTVDGAVPVICKPRSGSFFKLGKTKVTCSASDKSGNTARVTFVVTVQEA
jgi:HYR domain